MPLSTLMPGTRKHQDDPHTVVVESTPMLPVIPDRPAPSYERKKIKLDAVLKRFGWTQDDLRLATDRFQFPVGDQVPVKLGWSTTLVWWEDTIDAWVGQRRSDIAEQQRLIKFW